mgnify:FL=1
MLTRRRMLKAAAAIGLGAVLQIKAYSALAGVPEKVGGEPSLGPRSGAQSSIPAIEAWEDFWDDLDCVELLDRYTSFLSRENLIGDKATSTWAIQCPLARSKSHKGIIVRSHYFCHDCGKFSSAVDLCAEMEDVSYPEAVRRLRRMLKTGELRGFRPEQEALGAITADAAQFYHWALTESPEGRPAREFLEQKGITCETIERFHLGTAAPTLMRELAEHLWAKGYSSKQIRDSDLVSRPSACEMRLGVQSQVRVPATDSNGHAWGFLRRGCSLDGLVRMYRLSPNRFRRHIFPFPVWPQDLNRFSSVLLEHNFLNVLTLHQAGITNAVCVGYYSPASTDQSIRFRPAATMAHRLIYCAPLDTLLGIPWEVEGLFREIQGYLDRLDLLVLPGEHTLRSLLDAEGPAAFRERLSHPVAIKDLLGA